MNPSSVTEIKRHVIQGADVKRCPAPLYVNEHDGEMWATNRFWLTRAAHVAPLLEQYNLSATEPGAFEVNGTVRPATGQHGISMTPPDMGSFIRSQRDYSPGVPVRIAGNQAYTRGDRGGLYAAYLMADGTHAGLSAEILEWLSSDAAVRVIALPEQEDGTHLRYGDVRVSFRKPATGGISAMVSAEVFRVIERAHYADEGRGDFIPAVEEACEPRVLGIMMAMNYNA